MRQFLVVGYNVCNVDVAVILFDKNVFTNLISVMDIHQAQP